MIAAVGLAGCEGHRQRVAPVTDEPSHAADAILKEAATPEEQHALERVRDEIDLEMRERVHVLDAEIQALQRENDELGRKLREP